MGSMSARSRAARLGVGASFLVLAGAVAKREAPRGIALWPLAPVLAWFGVSHLVAAFIAYHGCPELGAIPSVIQGRPVGSRCAAWDLIDSTLNREAR